MSHNHRVRPSTSTAHVTTVPVRAALYLRVSLDATGQGLAVDRQREDCERIASERGWTVDEVYTDNSISASDKRKDRPAYNRLVADFEAGRFDALICWDLDRLTRQPRQLEDWIDAAEERGLRLVTANGEADLTTDGGRLFARIKAAVARGEVERKSARQRRARQQAAEQGRPNLGVRLTGYTTGGVVILDEAAMVRQVFERFAAGESLKGLARWLTEAGYRTRRGGRWSPSSLHDMLANPRYVGRVVYRGEVVEGVAATWQPIVDDGLWTLVAARLSDPGRRCQQGTDRRHLGSGLFRCTCGKPVRYWSGRRYRCPECGYTRSAAPVDAFVETLILDRLADPDLADLLAAGDDPERAEALLIEGKQIRAQIATAEDDYADGLIDARLLRKTTDRLTARLAEVDRERVRLLGTGPGSVLAAPDPAQAYRSASLMIRRAVVETLAEVTLHPTNRSHTFNPETVSVRWL